MTGFLWNHWPGSRGIGGRDRLEFAAHIKPSHLSVWAFCDPHAEVDFYLQLACEKQVEITHIFETHSHNDVAKGKKKR
jgi:glyoxylase-like metal-dependent hydrolase (beta-lactamase superfamily II)